jgi:hypothetical protein
VAPDPDLSFKAANPVGFIQLKFKLCSHRPEEYIQMWEKAEVAQDLSGG